MDEWTADRNSTLLEGLQRFLDSATDRQFLVVIDGHEGDQFVQFQRRNGILYGEVGSREWTSDVDSGRRIDDDATARLAAFGFTGGGPKHNFGRDRLAQSAPYLAELTLELFEAAYGTPHYWRSRSSATSRSLSAWPHRRPRRSPRPPPPYWTEDLRVAPVKAAEELRDRVAGALQSNLSIIWTTGDEVVAIRNAVEAAGTWDRLPDWVRHWIEKAEQAPLWVTLPPR